jgi:hypothetical protein
MPDKDYKALAEKHGGVSSPAQSTEKQHESSSAVIPPELQRIEHAVGVNYVSGKPFKGYGGNQVIASVAQGEPHKIEINDKNKWNQAPLQERAHELTHLLMNQLAGPIRNAIPPDDPNHPYDISNVDQLRAKGMKLWQLPQERAARIMQVYSADPSQRKRLQPWVDDLNSAPLSVMDPTGPNDKTINRHPRAPIPPPEAYANLDALKDEAQRRKP